MDKKMIYVAAVVVVLVAAVAVVMTMNGGDDTESVSGMDDAELKVFGNANGDRWIDSKDVNLIKDYINDGEVVADRPLADANQDGVIDSKDVDVVNKIINGESTTIYHINYHDVDGDAIVDQYVASTQFPITSAITLGTGNNLMLFYCLGIYDEIKAATYASSADAGLYGDIYLNESKVVKLGTSILEIEFEGGKVGSSDVISKEGVTAVIGNHSTSCLPNEKDFENYGVDVVRIPASSADRNEFIHTVMLTGLLFQKVDNAEKYLNLSLEVLDYTLDKTKNASGAKAIVSTMSGYVSVGDSDYREYLSLINVDYPIDAEDLGVQKNSVKIVDYPNIYIDFEFDTIIHARSGLTYGQTPGSNAEFWETYTSKFSDWEHAETGQYVVSTSLPVALRVAYIAHTVYPDLIDLNVLEDYHQEFVDDIYINDNIDLSKIDFILTPEMMA